MFYPFLAIKFIFSCSTISQGILWEILNQIF